MDLEKELRKLARSSYWQRISNSSQKNFGIQLFDNVKDLSGIQTLFLYWVEVYNMLYKEYVEQEWDHLSEDVIKDDIRCDAFMYWRQKELEKKIRKYKQDQKEHERSSKKGARGGRGNMTNYKIYKGSGKS